ncbi:hypothetical protein QGN05_15585, partial [Achromobacter xylosoxidans]
MSVTLKRFDDAPYEQQCEATVIAVGAAGVALGHTLCYARRGGPAGARCTTTPKAARHHAPGAAIRGTRDSARAPHWRRHAPGFPGRGRT